MDAPAGIDLQDLVAAEADAGPDPRADYSPNSPYYRLRDMRAEARAAERAADAEGDPESGWPPQWRQIAELATQVLETSKDLEIAAWLTEALLRMEGLDGLAAGFRLMKGLIEARWDRLYPLPDEDGIATRVAPITGLNGEGGDGTLIQPLRKLTLFERPDGSPVFLWQYAQSADVSAIGDSVRRQQKLDSGIPSFEDVEAQARAAATHLAELRNVAERAAEEWAGLSAALDARAGPDAPPTSRVRDVLAQIISITSRYAAPSAVPVPEEGSVRTPLAASAAPRPAGPSGGPDSREEALRLLEQVAEFFRSTEPQSPLAYTLTETVRRARLPWPDLLTEIVPDASTRAAILTTLGIRPPEA